MTKKFTISLLAILFCFFSHAQYTLPQNNVWAMGYHCGVDFNSGTPVPITTNISSFEGCASVCDSTGTLLFYTDGNTLWNGATGAVMPFGAVINGGGNNTTSTTQGALIVPDPGNYNRYYVFSQSAHPVSNLFCNIVDMSMNGGAGALDTGFIHRGVMLGDSMSEKMVAVKGCDNNIWVVTHSKVDSTFMSYLITPFGMNINPVVSVTSSGAQPAQYNFQVMKVSPDRSKLAVGGTDRLELFDFNFYTGQVTNPVLLSSTPAGYGGAFSPDGTKYYSAGEQYDLSAPDPSLAVTDLNMPIVSDMRLAPDGKIYFKSPTQVGHTFLGRINNPNAAGFACNIQDSVTSLAYPLAGLTYGLPQEVVVADHDYIMSTQVAMDTLLCRPASGGITLTGGGSFRIWDDGSNTPTRTITRPGIYTVYYMDGACKAQMDSFIIKGLITPAVITFNNPLLRTTEVYASYQWYKGGAALPGETGQTCFISSNGQYSVVVHDQWGCSDTAFLNVSTFTAIEDLSQLRSLINIYPNPARDLLHVDAPFRAGLSLYNTEGKLLLTGRGKTLNIGGLATGLYLLRIEDEKGRKISIEKINKL